MISLVLLNDGVDAPGLAQTVESLQAQTHKSWELLVPGVSAETEFPDEARVVAVDSVEAAIGRAGAFVGFLDGGDTLEASTLALLLDELASGAHVVGVYTDEDRPIGTSSTDRDVVLKPDWSPERERHGDYVGLLCLLRTEVVVDSGGWNADAGPAAFYDLVLRVTESGAVLAHVPQVLCHAASVLTVDDDSEQACRAAAQRHLDRIGIAGIVEAGPVSGTHRIVRELDPAVRVSVVIPTRWTEAEIWGERQCLPIEAVRTMRARTHHTALEFVVVYDEPVPPGALEALREAAGDSLITIAYRKPFNFSEKCNIGFLHANGDVIVFANDDLQPRSDRWIESLVAPVLESDVGLVGTKLIYDDGSIQHGGHVHLPSENRNHPRLAYRSEPADTAGDLNSLVVNREVSGVTGACVAVRRRVFEAVGGFAEELPASYNDVDLTLKVAGLGLRILWLAEPVLFHFESKSRAPAVKPGEGDFMFERWGGFVREPYLPWLALPDTPSPAATPSTADAPTLVPAEPPVPAASRDGGRSA